MQAVLDNDMRDYWNYRKGYVTQSVDSKLDNDGFPTNITNHSSIKALFTDGQVISYAGKNEQGGNYPAGSITVRGKQVNHLFLKSYYDENGMFHYSSLDNYAYLGNNNNFTVYREPGTPDVNPSQTDHYYYFHGHFMPFNDIDPTKNVSRLVDQYGKLTDRYEGRSYENVYGIQGDKDYYFGLSMEAKFVQPSDGTLANGDPVVYRFTGDDDLWVFIDDILVLDISGIHEPLSGSIDFSTGIVYQPNFFAQNTNGMFGQHTTTLREIFEAAVNNNLISRDQFDAIGWKGNTFADYSTHTFKMFYMERGAGASNLDITFNLQVIKPGEFVVRKSLPEKVNLKYVNDKYRFTAAYKDKYDNSERPLYAGAPNSRGEVVCDKVFYKDRKDENGKPIEVPVRFIQDSSAESPYNYYFELEAGEAVVFSMTDETTQYCVKEIMLNGDLIDTVQINKADPISVIGQNQEVGTTFASAINQGELNFRNNPYIQNLLITKHLYDENGEVIPFDNLPNPCPVFEFRVYLESIVVENGVEKKMLVPYANGPYYLMRDNEYYTLDRTDGSGNTNLPNNHGTTKTICSNTGNTGTINSIPPEYTIVIPDLIAGTSFYIEERRDNMPDGYEFVEEILTPGTYDRSNLEDEPIEVLEKHLVRQDGDNQEFDIKTVGMIKKEKDAQSHVYNRKPLIDITVEKQWEDNGTGHPNAVSLKLLRYKKDIGENGGGGDTPTDKKAYIIIQHNSSGIENTVDLPQGFEVTYDIIGLTTYRGVPAGRYQVTPGSKYTVIAHVANAAAPGNYTYLGTSEWQGEVSENNGEYPAALTSTYRKNGEKARVTIPPATWNYKTVTGTGEYHAGDRLLFTMTVKKHRNIEIKLGDVNIDPNHDLIQYVNQNQDDVETLVLRYQIPDNLADGTVLPLSIVDGWWKLDSLNISKDTGNNSTQQSAPAYTAGFNPALSPSLMNEGGNNTTRDGSGNTNDQASDLPAGVPAGYVLDSDFDDDGEMDISLPLSDSSWSTIIENLDARGKKGYLYYYVLVEDDVPEGYTVSYENNPAYKQDDNEQGGATITAINTKKTGNLELTKQVVGNGADSDKAFEFTIVLKAPAGKTLSESGYSFSGTMTTGNASYAPAEDKTTATVSGISLKAIETFKIVGLPVGTEYTITETDYSNENYQTDHRVTTGIISGGEKTDYVTVTNSKYNVTVEVLKIDETTRSNNPPTIVPGAEFTLYKKNNEGRYEDVIGPLATDTQNNGLLDFNDLSLGDYKLSETKIPAGFVKTAGDIFFTVKVNSSGEPTVIWKDGDGGDEITGSQGSVSFSSVENQFKFKFIVGNTPGAILPSTGGPGTNILYLIGCILTILAGVGVVMRRKRREAA